MFEFNNSKLASILILKNQNLNRKYHPTVKTHMRSHISFKLDYVETHMSSHISFKLD